MIFSLLQWFPRTFSILGGCLYWLFLQDWRRAVNWFVLDIFTLSLHRGFTIWIDDHDGCRLDTAFAVLYTGVQVLAVLYFVIGATLHSLGFY